MPTNYLSQIEEAQDYLNKVRRSRNWHHLGLPMTNYTDDYPFGVLKHGPIYNANATKVAGMYVPPKYNSIHAKDTIYVSDAYPLKEYSIYQPIGLNPSTPTSTPLHELAHSLQFMIQNPTAKRYLDTLSATLQYLNKLDYYGVRPSLSNKLTPAYNYPGEPEAELISLELEKILSDIQNGRYSLGNFINSKNQPASVLSKDKPIKMQYLNEDLSDLSNRLAGVLLNYPTVRGNVYYHNTQEHKDNVKKIQQEMDKRLAGSIAEAAASARGESPGGNILYKIIEGVSPSTESIIKAVKFIKDAPRPGSIVRDFLNNTYNMLSQKEDERKRKEAKKREAVANIANAQVPTMGSVLVDLWNMTHKKAKK